MYKFASATRANGPIYGFDGALVPQEVLADGLGRLECQIAILDAPHSDLLRIIYDRHINNYSGNRQ